MCTQAKGNVLIHQKMFESRLFFVDNLIDMGAQIILCDPHRATVMGLDKRIALRGIQMTSPDIRAGVSLLIAAMSAKGKSTIHNIEQIDRGYQHIEHRLNALGAKTTKGTHLGVPLRLDRPTRQPTSDPGRNMLLPSRQRQPAGNGPSPGQLTQGCSPEFRARVCCHTTTVG